MRQIDNRAAAPVNAAPRWPAGYIEVLRQAGAADKTVPYCLQWVRQFFAENPGRRRRDLGRKEIEAFLSALAARPGVTNWRVQQARDSLELYSPEQFRGIALEPRPDVPTPHDLSPAASPPATSASASESPSNGAPLAQVIQASSACYDAGAKGSRRM